MVIAGFSVKDRLEKVWFFEKTFLLADTSMEVVLGMPFLTLSDVDIHFIEKKLEWRKYSIAQTLITIQRFELIDKKEFAATVIDENAETFMVYVATLSTPMMPVYLSHWAQIRLLIAEKTPTRVLSKYSDYADVFLFDFAIELSENTGMNEYAIELEEGKQPPYGSIYSLEPMELETLKTYIKIHLKTGFIQPSKSPAGARIFFDWKQNENIHLYIHYQSLNNFTIKNR